MARRNFPLGGGRCILSCIQNRTPFIPGSCRFFWTLRSFSPDFQHLSSAHITRHYFPKASYPSLLLSPRRLHIPTRLDFPISASTLYFRLFRVKNLPNKNILTDRFFILHRIPPPKCLAFTNFMEQKCKHIILKTDISSRMLRFWT